MANWWDEAPLAQQSEQQEPWWGEAPLAEPNPASPAPVTPGETSFAAARRQAVPVIPEEQEKPSYNVLRGIGERATELGGNLLALGQRGAEQLQETFADLPTEIVWGGGEGLRLMSPNEIKQMEEETGRPYTELRLLGSAADAWRETELGYVQNEGWERGKQTLLDPDASFLDKAGGVGDIVSWGFETGLVSLPDMAAVLTNMPAYLASRTNEIAEERAQADGRNTEDLEASDLTIGAGTALVVSILERFGAQKLLDIRNAGGSIIGGITKGATAEGLTEAQQELAEYLGTQLGTERGVNFLEGLERTLQGVVGGGAFGAPAGGVSAAVGRLSRTGQEAEQRTAAIAQDLDDSLAQAALTPEEEVAIQEEQMWQQRAAEQAGVAEAAAARQAIPATAEPVPAAEPAAEVVPIAEAAAAQEAAPQPMAEDVAEGERLETLTAQVSDQPQVAGMQFLGAEGAPAPAPALVQTIEAFNLPLQEYQQTTAQAEGRRGRPPVATGDQLRAVDSAWTYLNSQVDALNAAGYNTKPLIQALRKAAGTQSLRGKVMQARGDQPVTGRIKGGDIVQLGGRSKNTPKGGWGNVVNNFFTEAYTALNNMLQAGPITAPQGGIQIPAQPSTIPVVEAEPAPAPVAVPVVEAAPTAVPEPTPVLEAAPEPQAEEVPAGYETTPEERAAIEARNQALKEAQAPKPKGGMTEAEARTQAEAAQQPTKQVGEVQVATRGKRIVVPKEKATKGEALKTKAAERRKGKLSLKKKPEAKPAAPKAMALKRKPVVEPEAPPPQPPEEVRKEDATRVRQTETAAISQIDEDLRADILDARETAAGVMELELGIGETNSGETNSGDLLRAIQAELDPEDSFSVLANKLARTAAGNIPVEMLTTSQADVVMNGATGMYRSFTDPQGNRVRRIALNEGVVGDRVGVKVFLHELVHAATAEGTTTDNKLALELNRLRRRTRRHLQEIGDTAALDAYGFTNVDEFIAEAMTNADFQRILAGVPTKNNRNLWHEFVAAIARFLGIEPENESALSEVLSLAPDLFMTEEQVAEAGARPRRFISNIKEEKIAPPTESEMAGWMLGDYSSRELMDRTRAVNTSKKLGNTLTGEITGKIYDATKGRLDIDQARRSGTQIGLGFHTLDQIIRRFKDRFQDGSANSLTGYQSVVRKKNQYARENQQKAERLNEKWRQYEKRGPKNAETLGKFMHDATMSDIHPDLPFNHPKNAHLAKRKGAKDQHRRMQKRFNDLPAGGRGIYRAAAKFYRDQRNDLRRATVEHIARSWNLDKVLPPAAYNQLKNIEQPADVDTIDFSALEEQEDKVKDSLKSAVNLTSVKGPYFPLRRFGKWVVEGNKEGEQIGKNHAKREEAWKAARRLRADNPTDRIRTRKAKDGTYYNERVTRNVKMFDSVTEAERWANKLQDEGYRGRTGGAVPVSLKEDWNMPPGSNAGVLLSQAKRKVEGNKTLEASLDTAFLELLLENNMRKSENPRKKIAGASYDMRRAFAERAYAGSWGIADIQTALDHHDAMNEMRKRTRDDARLGEVLQELRLRDEKSLGDRRISKAESFISQFGFVNYLFSPSYTMINLTQVPLVAAPYLNARYGARSMSELMKAYRGVAGAGGNELRRVRFGAKGAPVNALDAMMGQLDKGERQAIETLSERGIIDATFMQELYKTSQGAGESLVWNKIMDLARTMPQVAEVLNRIVVARAAYNLEMRKSKSQAKAEEAASEAVLQTQFDYTDQNKPRYFKFFPGARAIMMFKMYAQGMYALIGSAAYQGRIGAPRSEQRAIARKTLAGLIATHSLTAGALGGVFMEPVRALISAAQYLFEDDDEPWDLDDAVTQAIFDMTGSAAATELITRGVPRAAGIDLFGRVGLNNMAFMGGREARSYQEKYRNFLVALGGPIAGAGDNIALGMQYLSRGEMRRGFEAISPKLVRDALKTWRIADEGLLDYNGDIIAGKQDFNTGDYISQALGIQPATMARTYEARTAQKGRETKLRDRRKKLMMQWRRKDPKERAAFFRSTIMAYNRKNPEFRIEPGQLLRSIGEQRRREAQTRAGAFTEKAAIRRIGEAYGG